MIVTVVCDVLGEENNGTTIAAMNFIRFLKEQGHTVRILCADQDKIGQENIYVVPNMNFGYLLNKYVSKVGVSLAKPQKDVIESALKGADVVHIMVPLLLGLSACKMARKMGLPITAGFHMQAENLTAYIKMNYKPVNKFVYKFIYKHLYRYCDGIHYPTLFIRRIFELSVKHHTNGYVISNGVHDYVKKREVEKPKEFKDKYVILSTGRYAREKAQDVLLKAIKYSKYKDKIQVILAGQGIKEKKYKKISQDLPVQPIFKLYERKEIIDVLNYSDMYVHPAEMELEGIACLEAIACGKLTIVSDSKKSATKDFAVSEKCIFKKHDPKDLASKIDYFIEHPVESEEVEKLYLENSVVYSQDECMHRMEKMLYGAIEHHKKYSHR